MSALSPKASSGSRLEDLCLSCGLCCNGAIFADVKLKAGDDADKLKSLGLRFGPAPHSSSPSQRKTTRGLKFCQPCSAFQTDGRCAIYDQRPAQCSTFQCLQLKDLYKGATNRTQALAQIRIAKQRLNKVQALLRSLGDTDEDLAVRLRFGRTARRLQLVGMDQATARLYGQLTLAAHDLNFILSDSFYPG